MPNVCNSWCVIANPISEKILVHELWLKMLLANKIAGFLKEEREV